MARHILFYLCAGPFLTALASCQSINLVTDSLEAGNYAEAERALRQIGHTSESVELDNAWGSLYLAQGNLAKAEREFVHARSILERRAEPGGDYPVVLHNLAAVELRTGRYREAYSDAERAVVLWQKTLPADDPNLIRAWASFSSLQFLIGQSQAARISIERAIGSAEKTGNPLLPRLLQSYAVILDRLNRKKEAKQARKRAKLSGPAVNQTERLVVNAHAALPAGIELTDR